MGRTVNTIAFVKTRATVQLQMVTVIARQDGKEGLATFLAQQDFMALNVNRSVSVVMGQLAIR